MPAATKAAHVAIPDHIKGNPSALKYRFDRFYTELCQRKAGTPWHPAMLSDASESPSEIAIDCIALAKAYIEAEERAISEGAYRR